MGKQNATNKKIKLIIILSLVLSLLLGSYLFLYKTNLVKAESFKIQQQFQIKSYDGQKDFSLFIGENNSLYASGSNGSGQLGRKFVDEVKWVEPLGYKTLENVKKIATGKNGFSYALTEDNKLYSWGNNEFLQLSHGGDSVLSKEDANFKTGVPTKVEINEAIVITDVVLGQRHSMVLSQDGKVYTVGSNATGQLGHSEIEAHRLNVLGDFKQIEQSYFNNEKVIDITSCEQTSFALTESGDVYSWGYNNYSQLGVGKDKEELNIANYPIKTLLTNIKQISAKSTTAMALSNDNKVFVWGNNQLGQAGIEEYFDFTQTKVLVESIATPQEINKFYDQNGQQITTTIKEIMCGGITNFVLSTDGRVFSFGNESNGSSGFDVKKVMKTSNKVKESFVVVPTIIKFYQPLDIYKDKTENINELKEISPVDTNIEIDVKIDSLEGSIGVRTYLKDINGDMYSFGDNESGQVSSGNIVLWCNSPIKSTLFRNDIYDKVIKTKNYMLKPIIGLSIIFGGVILMVVYIEVKRIVVKRKFKANEKLDVAKSH